MGHDLVDEELQGSGDDEKELHLGLSAFETRLFGETRVCVMKLRERWVPGVQARL